MSSNNKTKFTKNHTNINNSICNHVKKTTLYLHELYREHHDVTIMRLIKYIHYNEINILNSCGNDYITGNNNYVWIEFKSLDDCEKFMRIVIFDLDEDDDMRIRALSNNCALGSWKHANKYIHDTKSNKITTLPSVRFPQSDYKFVTYILKHYCIIGMPDRDDDHVSDDDSYENFGENDYSIHDINNTYLQYPIINNNTYNNKRYVKLKVFSDYDDTHDSRNQIYSRYRKEQNSRECLIKDISFLIRNISIDEEMGENILHELKYIISPKGESKHDTIPVFYSALNKHIDIDKNIAPLLEYIWKNDIMTNNSCENSFPKDHIWISFDSTEDLEKFLNIVFRDIEEDADFYKRGFNPMNVKNSWYYRSWFDWSCGNIPYKDVCAYISLRFPKSDYDIVLNNLKSYYEKIISYSNNAITSDYGSDYGSDSNADDTSSE